MSTQDKKINVQVEVTGNFDTQLQSLSTSLASIDKAVKSVQDSINTLGTNIGKIAVPDSFKGVVAEIEKLGKIKVPNLDQLATGFAKLGAIKDVPDLSKIVAELAQFNGIQEKLPDLRNIAEGFDRLAASTAKAIPNFTGISTEIKKLGGIELPNLAQIADGFERLIKIIGSEGGVPKFGVLSAELRKLKGIELPNLGQIATGFEKLAAIKDSIPNLKPFADQLSQFKEIKLPNFGQLASGFKTFYDLAGESSSKKLSVPNFSAFKKQLESLSGIQIPNLGQLAAGIKTLAEMPADKIPDLKPLADQIRNFNGLTVPNFGQLVTGLKKLADPDLRMDLVAQRLNSVQYVLKGFTGLRVDTNIESIANGLLRLTGAIAVPTATIDSIGKLVVVIGKLNGIQIPNIEQLADGFRKFKTIKIDDIIPKIGPLADALRDLDKLKVPNILQLAVGLEKLSKIKVDELKKNLVDLNTAIKELAAGGQLSQFAAFADQLKSTVTVLSAFTRANREAGRSIKDAGNDMASTGPVIDGLKKKFETFIQYRFVSDIVNSLREALMTVVPSIMTFNQSLKDLQAISNATDNDVAKMSGTIKDLATSGKFSLKDLSDGMTIIAQAGYSARDSIKMIGDVSNLSTGTLSAMATTVDLVTSVMSVFDIQAKDTAHITDVLANSINLSKLDVDKLRTAFNYIGPVAAEANVSFEEVSASMMVLANSGQKASTIGTGLRNVFSLLLSPSDALKEAADGVGIALEQLDPRVTPFSKVLQNLKPIVQDSQHALEIFGKRGASAVLSLANTSDSFDNMLSLTGKTGTAAAMAAIQMEGLGASYQNLKNKMELLAVTAGDGGLSAGLGLLINLGRTLADALLYLANNPVGKLILGFTSLTAGLGLLGVAIGALKLAATTRGFIFMAQGVQAVFTAVTSAFTATTAFGGSVSVLGAAINPVAAGLMILAAAIAYLTLTSRDYTKEIREMSKAADELGTVGDKLKAYTTSTASMQKGSEELKASTTSLRNDILKTATGIDSVKKEAYAAANSINVLTGEFIDGGKAMEEFTSKVDQNRIKKLAAGVKLAYGSLAEESSSSDRLLGGIYDRAGQALKNVGTQVSAGIALFTGQFEEASRKWKETDLFGESQGRLNKRAVDVSGIQKAVSAGKASYADLENYVKQLDLSTPLTSQEADVVKAFKNVQEASSAFLQALLDSDKISLDSTIDQVEHLGKAADLSASQLQGVVAQFKAATAGRANAPGQAGTWSMEYDKAGITDSEAAMSKLTERLNAYGAVWKSVSSTADSSVRTTLIGLEKQRFALAEKAKSIADTYKAELAAAGDNSTAILDAIQKRDSAERLLSDDVIKYNKAVLADDNAVIAGRLQAHQKLYDDVMAKNAALYKDSPKLLGEANAKARAELLKSSQEAVEMIYPAKEVLNNYKVSKSDIELATQKHLSNISRLQSEHAITEEQARILSVNQEAHKWNETVRLAQAAFDKISKKEKEGSQPYTMAKQNLDDSLIQQQKAQSAQLLELDKQKLEGLKEAQALEVASYTKHNSTIQAVEAQRHAKGLTTDRQFQDIQFSLQNAHNQKMVELAKQYVETLLSSGKFNVNDKEVREAQKNVEAEVTKSNEFIANHAVNTAERQREDIKISREKEVADLKNTESKRLNEIAVNEAAEVYTRRQAEEAKFNVTLEYLQKTRDALQQQKNDTTSSPNGIDAKELERINNDIKKADDDIYEHKTRNLVEYTKKYTEQNKELTKLSGTNGKMDDANATFNAKRIKDEKDLERNLEKINTDLKDKKLDIEHELDQKRKDFNKERVDNEKATNAKILGINSSSEDLISGIKQRKMPESRKASDNDRIAAKKYAEGTALIEEAARTNDKDKLARGESLIEQYRDLAAERKKESAAIDGVRAAQAALDKAANVEKQIKDAEILRKETEAAAEAEYKKKEAAESAQNKTLDISTAYKDARQAEDERHKVAIQNIQAEIDKTKELVQLYRDMVNAAKEASADASTSGQSAEKTTDVGKGEYKKDGKKVTMYIPQGSSTSKTDAALDNTTEKAKAPGRAFSESMRQGSTEAESAVTGSYSRIEEKGKVTWTNVSEAQRSAGENAAASTEDSASKSIGNIETIGTKAARVVRDEFGRVVSIAGEGVSVKIKRDPNSDDIGNAIPSTLNVEVRAQVQGAREAIKSIQSDFDSLVVKSRESGSSMVAGIIPPEAFDKIATLKDRFADLFHSADNIKPAQAVQDMITTFNSLMEQGKMSAREAGEMTNKIMESTKALGDGKSIFIELRGGKEFLTMITESGEKVTGLQNKLQSNPFTLGFDDSIIMRSLEKLPGVVDNIRKQIEVPITAPPINTDNITQPLQKIEEKKTTAVVDVDSTKIDEAKTKAESLNTETKSTHTVEAPTLETILAKVESLQNMKIGLSIEATDDVKLQKILDTIEGIEGKDKQTIEIEIEGAEDITALSIVLDSIVSKTIKVIAEVSGIDSVQSLKASIDALHDKVVTITTRHISTGGDSGSTVQAATGGLIQAFATGGSVFKRLANRFITAGSGTKDDVPALLMKDEFVQRSAAVKKYGVGFMHAVNNLQFPQSLAKQFNTGGLVTSLSDFSTKTVQHFSKGGKVLGGMKKRLEDIIGMGTEGLSVGSMNIINGIQDTAKNIVSPIGTDIVSGIVNGVSNAVARFAGGGSAGKASDLSTIISGYDKQIALAQQNGQAEVAAILTKEKKDMIALSIMVEKNLKMAEEEYQQKLESVGTQTLTEKEKLDQEYALTKRTEEQEYAKQKLEDKIAEEQADREYTQNILDAEADYKRSKQELSDALPDDLADYKANLAEKQAEVDEFIKKRDDFKQKHSSPWSLPKRSQALQNASVREVIEQYYRTAWGTGSPGNMSWKLGPIDPSFTATYLSKYEAEIGNPLTQAQSELSTLKKENPSSVYQKEIETLVSDYEKTKAESEISRAQELTKRAQSAMERDSGFKASRLEADIAYKESLTQLNQSSSSAESTTKGEYVSVVNGIKGEFESAKKTIQRITASAVDSAKIGVGNAIADISSAKNITQQSIGTSTPSSQSVGASLSMSQYGLSIEELLKRLGKGIMKFHTGGFVPFISGATRGIDSILAHLTPEEYVISAPAVRALGVPFLDSLNSLQIPAFNSGGPVSADAAGLSSEKVMHALDLTYNGSHIGELQGDQLTVEGFLSSLNAARLRS